jgi:hypothetical protein
VWSREALQPPPDSAGTVEANDFKLPMLPTALSRLARHSVALVLLVSQRWGRAGYCGARSYIPPNLVKSAPAHRDRARKLRRGAREVVEEESDAWGPLHSESRAGQDIGADDRPHNAALARAG